MGQVIDLIILQEDYTQQDCEHLLNTMIQEFKNCDYISDYFKADNVSNKLKWLNSNNRRSLGMCEAKPYKHYYVNDPDYINDTYYEKDDYSRLSDPVKNLSKYNCKKCGGNINSYILNSKGEYELFKSYSDEPQYKYFIKCPDCGYISGFKTRNNTFKELLTALLLGRSLKCPKCKKENMFMSVDGTILDKDTKDNIRGYDEHGFTFYK